MRGYDGGVGGIGENRGGGVIGGKQGLGEVGGGGARGWGLHIGLRGTWGPEPVGLGGAGELDMAQVLLREVLVMRTYEEILAVPGK